ncbi:isochorismatase family protein, partial [Vibrio parahaemolyticus]|uniref:isochorismatase family protein n=1 Tax=Vibrio parahaemolyticus TaxID=670 RepID=UPI002111EB6D
EIIQKQHSDSFYQTDIEQALERNGVDELLICGMMTQNCLTHTAISKAAEKYNVSIIEDCCTTTDQMIHNIALSAVSIRVP